MNLTKIIAHLVIIAATMSSLSEAGNSNQQSQQGISGDDSYTTKTTSTPMAIPVSTPTTTFDDNHGSYNCSLDRFRHHLKRTRPRQQLPRRLHASTKGDVSDSTNGGVSGGAGGGVSGTANGGVSGSVSGGVGGSQS
ncbi:hypothetical protein DVH05_010299 [Phytophthora capsici]|nr:hypothetical protein DVH05_010299 [Phytophthora capsici]